MLQIFTEINFRLTVELKINQTTVYNITTFMYVGIELCTYSYECTVAMALNHDSKLEGKGFAKINDNNNYSQ